MSKNIKNKKSLNNKDREILKKKYHSHCVICDKYTQFPECSHIISTKPEGPRSHTKYERYSCLEKTQVNRFLNHVDNCILLCHSCHQKIDRNPEKYKVDDLHKLRIEKSEIHTEYDKLVQEIIDSILSKYVNDNTVFKLINKFSKSIIKSNQWIYDWFNIQKNLLKYNRILPFYLLNNIYIRIYKYQFNIDNLSDYINYIELCIKDDMKSNKPIISYNNVFGKYTIPASKCPSKCVSKYTLFLVGMPLINTSSENKNILAGKIIKKICYIYLKCHESSFKNFLKNFNIKKFPEFDLIKYYINVVNSIFIKRDVQIFNKQYIDKYTQKGIFKNFKFNIHDYIFKYP